MSLLSMRCPYCGVYTQIAPALVDQARHRVALPKPIPAEYVDRNNFIWWIGLCSNPQCGRPVLVLDNARKIYPAPQPAPSDERIPEHIRRDLDEAKNCATVSAWRACEAMARRAMQAACLVRGADAGKKLWEQIDQLAEKGVITQDVKAWAHEVRHLGNDGAHPPEDHSDDLVTQQDAEDALQLAEQFFDVVFVTPALAAERKAKRLGTP